MLHLKEMDGKSMRKYITACENKMGFDSPATESCVTDVNPFRAIPSCSSHMLHLSQVGKVPAHEFLKKLK